MIVGEKHIKEKYSNQLLDEEEETKIYTRVYARLETLYYLIYFLQIIPQLQPGRWSFM